MPAIDPQAMKNALENDTSGAIPKGEYLCKVHNIEDYVSKVGNKSVKITFKVVDDSPFNGRMVWDYAPIYSDKKSNVAFGYRKLNKMFEAAGLPIGHTDTLIDTTMLVELEVKPASGGFQAGNNVKGVSAAGDQYSERVGDEEKNGKPDTSEAENNDWGL